MVIFPRKFYQKSTVSVAKDLLGKVLIRKFENGELRKGRIVETEAYLGPKDLACHSSKGKTKRTEVMFGPAGHAYVYVVYGMHYMFNIVTEALGEAVLVRALEPLEGLAKDKSQALTSVPKFGFGESASPSVSDPRIAAGPGKLTKWLGIDKSFNGWDLTAGEKLWVSDGERKKLSFKRQSQSLALKNSPSEINIVKTKRVGVDYANEWADRKLRFYIEDNPAVSTT